MLSHVAYNAPSAIIVGPVVANAMMGRDHNGEIKMSKLHKSLALLLASGATAHVIGVRVATEGRRPGNTRASKQIKLTAERAAPGLGRRR